MEVLGRVFKIAETIYRLCERASSNKRQCERLKRRIKMLLRTAETLERCHSKSTHLQDMVGELLTTLENAECWVIKYSQRSWWKKVLQANRILDEFNFINDRLSDAANAILFLLSAEQALKLQQYFNEKAIKQQNKEDLVEDLKELSTHVANTAKREIITSMVQSVSSCHIVRAPGGYVESSSSTHAHVENNMDDTTNEMSDLSRKLAEISLACQRSVWDVTEIPGTDLRRGELLMERETHFLYRGEYRCSPVAIKVYKGQSGESEELIRRTFQDEREIMKRLESLNIVQLYGICIENSGSETSYSLVMELCSKGALRELLQREPDLTWERRIRMALDAARALYRLHQTEEKTFPPGTLSSSRFLVDEEYCVKLSVSALSNIESAIKKITHAESMKNSRELEYLAPETWRDPDTYRQSSQIYSLGVVMYEIAAGKRPFQGLEVTEDNLAQVQEQWRDNLEAELPPSCPQIFRDLIKRLLKKNPEDRPSAGVVVDFLLAYVNKCELERISAEASA